ncbi:MAG TPA: peroxiredoxin-like family protein [Cyclobacteriaceae bacterium]|nr:peroxiredoxin-like family protein [Cyclobacteriaceae bacterium]
MKSYLLLLIAILCSLQVLAQTGLEKGVTAPAFTAKDNSGKTVDLKKLLQSHKAVVLFFYRGQWCPYCNKYISQLQDSMLLFTAKDAYVVGVTPETDENISKTIEKTHASFSIIHDEGYKIMQAYRVNYTVDDATMSKMNKYGIDLEKNNGSKDNVLPVPATYVIDRSGKIVFVQFDKDFRNRASVSSLLEKL